VLDAHGRVERLLRNVLGLDGAALVVRVKDTEPDHVSRSGLDELLIGGATAVPCTLWLPPQPLESATRTSVAAMTPIRRKMDGSSAARAGAAITHFGVATWSIVTTRR